MFTNEELFHRWYVYPLRRLQEIPNGDGGFIALATSLFLYERYAKTVVKKSGKKADDNSVPTQLALDFNIEKHTAGYFWEVMRKGILHQGMPMQRQEGKGKDNLPGWVFNIGFIRPVEYNETKNRLEVQPWLFMDKVIELWQNNLDLLDEYQSYPWANIIPMEILNRDNDNDEWRSPPTGSPSGLSQFS